MALIEWRDEFCTGVPGVDYEHQELIRQINVIYAMIGEKSARENVIDALGDIYGSISAHFALEEKMMERHSYDHYKEHQADHERLLDDIQDISEEFEKST
jgi:hemerythrin